MIPDFQTIMLPLLQSLDDGKVQASVELRQSMISHFNISEEDQKLKTPTGKQSLLYNRIAWAVAYLKMGGLIFTPERGKYQITKEGSEVLENPPDRISIQFLKTLPNFQSNKSQNQKNETLDEEETEKRTPDELIDLGVSQINEELSGQLLAHIKGCSPWFFEQIVIDLLLKMGYGGSDIDNSEVTSNFERSILITFLKNKVSTENHLNPPQLSPTLSSSHQFAFVFHAE